MYLYLPAAYRVLLDQASHKLALANKANKENKSTHKQIANNTCLCVYVVYTRKKQARIIF